MLHDAQLSQIYQNYVDQSVRQQLENLLTGTTEGWGTSDTGKDKLFKSRGVGNKVFEQV